MIITNTEFMTVINTDGSTVGQNKIGITKFVGLGASCAELGWRIMKKERGLSNNEAEFKALILGMEEAISKKIKNAHFLLDSMIVMNRANGQRAKGKHKNERMDEFQDQVFELSKKFTSVKFSWIRREQNEAADELSKKAHWLELNVVFRLSQKKNT